MIHHTPKAFQVGQRVSVYRTHKLKRGTRAGFYAGEVLAIGRKKVTVKVSGYGVGRLVTIDVDPEQVR